MSRLRILAVLQTASNKPPLSQAPDPRATLKIRASEDTELLIDLVDDGLSPVQYAANQALSLTARPSPSVDDERVFRYDAAPAPLVGASTWRITFSASETRRKSTYFQRGFYDVLFVSAAGVRSLVIPPSPFYLLGAVSR